MAESSLHEAKKMNENKHLFDVDEVKELKKKVNELTELMKIITERAAFEVVD